MLQRGPTLTEQVKSHLKQRIACAAFEGGRIPSETDLADELKVSRTTIRDALSRLEAEGVIPRFCGQQMSYFLCELVPLLAPPWLTAHLELPAGLTAVLSLEEIAHNQDNLTLARTCSCFRDDLLRLRLIRRLA